MAFRELYEKNGRYGTKSHCEINMLVPPIARYTKTSQGNATKDERKIKPYTTIIFSLKRIYPFNNTHKYHIYHTSKKSLPHHEEERIRPPQKNKPSNANCYLAVLIFYTSIKHRFFKKISAINCSFVLFF